MRHNTKSSAGPQRSAWRLMCQKYHWLDSAHMRAFIYSSCYVYCNKMRAYILYEIQPMCQFSILVINEKLFLTNLPYRYRPLPVAVANWETMKATCLTLRHAHTCLVRIMFYYSIISLMMHYIHFCLFGRNVSSLITRFQLAKDYSRSKR